MVWSWLQAIMRSPVRWLAKLGAAVAAILVYGEMSRRKGHRDAERKASDRRQEVQDDTRQRIQDSREDRAREDRPGSGGDDDPDADTEWLQRYVDRD